MLMGSRNFYPNRKILRKFFLLGLIPASVKITAKITFETASTTITTPHRWKPRCMDREREREKSIRFASITGLTWREKSIDHPEPHGWRERDTRVLGPRTRNSPEMTVPRALFRQSAARFIANFRASITETMAANRCPCIPPCTSVRHRDSIESWSSIKLESSPPNNSYEGFVPITSLSTGKTPPQLSSFSKKTFLFLPFLLSPFSLFLCFLKKRFLLLFSSPLFFLESGNRSRVCFLFAIIRLENCIIISAKEKIVLAFSLQWSLSRERGIIFHAIQPPL